MHKLPAFRPKRVKICLFVSLKHALILINLAPNSVSREVGGRRNNEIDLMYSGADMEKSKRGCGCTASVTLGQDGLMNVHTLVGLLFNLVDPSSPLLQKNVMYHYHLNLVSSLGSSHQW